MFCPACGVENADNALFCNQCGVRIASMKPVSTATDPRVASAVLKPTQALEGLPPGLQGYGRDPTAFNTGDKIELPMVGPSRRTIIAIVTGVGLACGAAGAVFAWKALPHTTSSPPVTEVGLLGDPSRPPENNPDGGVTGEAMPVIPPPPRVASHTASRRGGRGNPSDNTNGGGESNPSATNGGNGGGSSNPSATNGGNGGGSSNPSPSNGGNGGGSSNPSPSNGGNSGGGSNSSPSNGTVANARDAATGSTTARPAGPVAENGVREVGPRNSQGGYRMGDETDATGTMDPRAFSYVYNHYRSQIAACHSTASRASPVTGVLVVRVRVGADGHVTRTRVISDSTRSPQLVSCVQNSMRGWRYPEPQGGDVEVDYPLRFGGG